MTTVSSTTRVAASPSTRSPAPPVLNTDTRRIVRSLLVSTPAPAPVIDRPSSVSGAFAAIDPTVTLLAQTPTIRNGALVAIAS